MQSDLVRRAQRGDEEAFAALVPGAVDRLLGVAYRILRDAALAEDATQQALTIAWRKLPTLRDPERFDAWTYRLLSTRVTQSRATPVQSIPLRLLDRRRRRHRQLLPDPRARSARAGFQQAIAGASDGRRSALPCRPVVRGDRRDRSTSRSGRRARACTTRSEHLGLPSRPTTSSRRIEARHE